MEYKNQHWITEAYLKAWRDHLTPNGAFVWVVTKNDHKIFPKAPRTLFSENEFYTAYDLRGNRVLELEHKLKEVEDNFILVRDKKLQKHKPLSSEDRKNIALFVSTTFARTKRQKEEGKEIWRDYINMVNDLPPNLSTIVKNSQDYRDVVALHSTQPMLFHLINFVNLTTPYLYQMNCAIYETSTSPGIITSDNPCFWFDPNIYNPNTPKPWFGLGSPTLNIMFPISPKQYLSLEKGGPDGYFDLTENPNQENIIDLINGFIATNCDEYIVVSQKNSKKNGLNKFILMSLPNLEGKYTSGKRRKKLFADSPRRRARLPVILIVLGLIALVFWLVPVYRVEPILPLQPEDIPTTTPIPTHTPTPTPTSAFTSFGGRIVFTCTRGEINQICAINADGTDYTQITDSFRNNYYPVFTPDMTGVVFAQNEGDYFDLYLQTFSDSKLTRLTKYIGNAFSPKFSPNGTQILFLNRIKDDPVSIWIMGPLGEDPHLLYAGEHTIVGADWSPDGKTIAFAMSTGQFNSYEVYLLDVLDPSQPPLQITHAVEGVTGSLDWALDGKSLLLCMGAAGDKNIFRLDLATGNATQLTFGGNNASASYSPDGQYIVFNSLRNDGQADLFIIRADGHSTRLLLDNPEPDWQPVWGP